ncbi:MAG: hypothetical protein GY862_34435 [Gammaproteobacteria bacterium]|nr:hypothetical protein [Gammaproteobacteria bacterium]
MRIAYILLICLLWMTGAPADAKKWCTHEPETLKEAVYRCGRASGPQVQRTKKIFKKMRRVADNSNRFRQRFEVIDIQDAPIALTLTDGIMLSHKGAVVLRRR